MLLMESPVTGSHTRLDLCSGYLSQVLEPKGNHCSGPFCHCDCVLIGGPEETHQKFLLVSVGSLL